MIISQIYLNFVRCQNFISIKFSIKSNPNMSQRSTIITLYKTLLHLGKDYPQGYDFFRSRLKNAFMKNKDVQDPKQLEQLVRKGEYVVKELEALYMLKKYRTLKRRYYE